MLVQVLTAALLGHGGGLDWKGGHYERRTGEYHYHQRRDAPKAPSEEERPAPPAPDREPRTKARTAPPGLSLAPPSETVDPAVAAGPKEPAPLLSVREPRTTARTSVPGQTETPAPPRTEGDNNTPAAIVLGSLIISVGIVVAVAIRP